jgi:hypothetical protein
VGIKTYAGIKQGLIEPGTASKANKEEPVLAEPLLLTIMTELFNLS